MLTYLNPNSSPTDINIFPLDLTTDTIYLRTTTRYIYSCM